MPHRNERLRVALTALLALAPFTASAQQPVTLTAPKLEIPIPNVNLTSAVTQGGGVSIPFLGQYISGIYNFMIGIVGLVAAVMMIVGGFEYLTSAGEKSKIEAGKKRIINALTGMALAFGSYLLLYVINPNLVTFSSLQLAGVPTVTYGDITELGGGTATPTPGTPSVPAPVADTGAHTAVCNSVDTCLPYCRAAGCTTVYCTAAEQRAGTCPGSNNAWTAVPRPWNNNCNTDGFPIERTHDILPPDSPDLKPIAWAGIHGIVAGGNVKATQLVIDGLQRAEKYIDDNYSGQRYQIRVNSCWRDYRADFGAQCAIMMRPSGNDPVASGSTWPGANPHSAGYACDLALTQNGVILSGGPGDQSCSSKGNGNRLLVQMLTNPTVGAHRLNYEVWHFNWAGWNNCYCVMGECDAHMFPTSYSCNSNNENHGC